MTTVNAKSIVEKFGRYVCPLTRLTLQYCKKGGSSRGMRDYINSGVKEFAEKNPEVSLYVFERKGRHPRIVANFVHGKSKIVEVKNANPDAIATWMQKLREESGKPWKVDKLERTILTSNPSIQGTWDPFMHKPLPPPPPPSQSNTT